MIQFSNFDNIILRNILFENNTSNGISSSALLNITQSLNVSLSYIKIKDNQMNCNNFLVGNFKLVINRWTIYN